MGIIWDSIKVMVLGMGTVFVALIALVFIVKAMHRFTDKESRSPVESDKQGYAEKDQAISQAAQLEGHDEEDEELVAVIAAAVVASLNRSTHDIVVRSIRRVPSITPIWNRVGRQEQIANRI